MRDIVRQYRLALAVRVDEHDVGGVLQEPERHQLFDGVSYCLEAAQVHVLDVQVERPTSSLVLLPFYERSDPGSCPSSTQGPVADANAIRARAYSMSKRAHRELRQVVVSVEPVRLDRRVLLAHVGDRHTASGAAVTRFTAPLQRKARSGRVRHAAFERIADRGLKLARRRNDRAGQQRSRDGA